MSHLLVWPLSPALKIVFSSPVFDLGTITCCDSFDIALLYGQQQFFLQQGVTGCLMADLKKMLSDVASGLLATGRFADSLLLGRDQLDQVLVEIRQGKAPLSYSVVSLEVIASWAAQLDLLQVVMEENENEKKSRGTGCCALD